MNRCSKLPVQRAIRFQSAVPSQNAFRACIRYNSTSLQTQETDALSSPASSSLQAAEANVIKNTPFRRRRSLFNGTSPPNLMKPDPLFDSAFSMTMRGRRSKRLSRVSIRNDPSYASVDEIKSTMEPPQKEEEKDALKTLPMSRDELDRLHQYPILVRRVTQQTGKGKKHRQYMLMVVGNGDGLVGYGEGKHDDFGITQSKALIEAVRNMDYVERFEKRTIWTDMSIKLGSTRILMRPRPVGFGLHCNPNIHQVLKAAGIKDISAKVWGSRNPINVVKATCMMIQAGNAPLSMGDGVGGKGRRLDAGSGMRSKESVERERGRKLEHGRAW